MSGDGIKQRSLVPLKTAPQVAFWALHPDTLTRQTVPDPYEVVLTSGDGSTRLCAWADADSGTRLYLSLGVGSRQVSCFMTEQALGATIDVLQRVQAVLRQRIDAVGNGGTINGEKGPDEPKDYNAMKVAAHITREPPA